jgi:hypothetical protein
MELINTNDEYSFDPTPKLKSSPMPIEFISFNVNDNKCIHCGEEYTRTLLFDDQKYCKKCLSYYISNINDNNVYLDVYYTMNIECSEHEIKTNEPQNIQECCRNCFEIFCFKQITAYQFSYIVPYSPYYNLYNNVLESEKHCKLCGKSLYQREGYIKKEFKLCSDCYLISSGCIKSTLTEQSIPIIYLPWWDSIHYCLACEISLTFTSDCQKHCENCLIFYTGCRYCLTTNVIFGPTNQSQCKKCKRVTSIIFDITKISSGNRDLDDFLLNLRLNIHNNLKITEFADKVKNIDKYFQPGLIYNSIYQNIQNIKISMEWIPYSRITNIKKIAKGGFGIIYQATWLDGSIDERDYGRYRNPNELVILKRFINSKDIDKYFLNEVNILTLTLSINVL